MRRLIFIWLLLFSTNGISGTIVTIDEAGRSESQTISKARVQELPTSSPDYPTRGVFIYGQDPRNLVCAIPLSRLNALRITVKELLDLAAQDNGVIECVMSGRWASPEYKIPHEETLMTVRATR